jgi:farnesyl-diphosphate farnesyltransferase
MQPPSLDRLNGILKRVSRSFYLSLKILPRPLRRPIGLAYLLARAADTIADTSLISPADRLTRLEQFRSLFRAYDTAVVDALCAALIGPQKIPEERELLASLDQCFAMLHASAPADRERISQLLLTLIRGMMTDLQTFPSEDAGSIAALKTRADLDLYTYHVAGCVGEFWTEMHVAHRSSLAGWDVEALKRQGVRFGKGLQLTNILRDLARDLRIGRCYIPSEDLAGCGLVPTDLLDPAAIVKLRPVLRGLLALTLDHYRQGWAYTLAIPRREVQMRLACIWPLSIGYRTLHLISRADNLLDPAVTVKISRYSVYRMLLLSGLLVGANWGLSRYARHLCRRVIV